MVRNAWITLCIFCWFSAQAQKKYVQSLDTSQVYLNPYMDPLDYSQFSGIHLLHAKVEVGRLNVALLEASVFFYLNQWRTKSHRYEFQIENKLQVISRGYVERYSKGRFEKNRSNYGRLNTFVHKVPKYITLDFSYIQAASGLVNLAHHKRGKYYYSKAYGTSEIDLYSGSRSRIDSMHSAIPIHLKTYGELAQEVVFKVTRGQSARYFRSKAYEIVGISIQATSIHSRRVNQLKYVVILGGYRIRFME